MHIFLIAVTNFKTNIIAYTLIVTIYWNPLFLILLLKLSLNKKVSQFCTATSLDIVQFSLTIRYTLLNIYQKSHSAQNQVWKRSTKKTHTHQKHKAITKPFTCYSLCLVRVVRSSNFNKKKKRREIQRYIQTRGWKL